MFSILLSLAIQQVVSQDLAYDKGGGYIRCLTLFANVDRTSIEDGNPNTKEEYLQHVNTINQLPSSVVKTLHWNSDIHKMTEELYGLRYKYDFTYNAIKS